MIYSGPLSPPPAHLPPPPPPLPKGPPPPPPHTPNNMVPPPPQTPKSMISMGPYDSSYDSSYETMYNGAYIGSDNLSPQFMNHGLGPGSWTMVAICQPAPIEFTPSEKCSFEDNRMTYVPAIDMPDMDFNSFDSSYFMPGNADESVSYPNNDGMKFTAGDTFRTNSTHDASRWGNTCMPSRDNFYENVGSTTYFSSRSDSPDLSYPNTPRADSGSSNPAYEAPCPSAMSWQLYQLNLSFDQEADSFNYKAPGNGENGMQKEQKMMRSFEQPKRKNKIQNRNIDKEADHTIKLDGKIASYHQMGQLRLDAVNDAAKFKRHHVTEGFKSDPNTGNFEMQMQSTERKYDTRNGELNWEPAIPAEVIEALQIFAEKAAEEHYRREDLENHEMSVKLYPYIPVDDQGNVTSLGSILHHTDDCKPCIFLKRDACHKRDLCFYCHLPHDEQAPKTASKKKRRSRKQLEPGHPVFAFCQ
eukprot:gnl/MRDRNA2_/MRDRNA2_90189_c0_seq1.p1 gnl/MRDRNA2_/MRDRNA2_90189_c0~~gnl/MRDRNA2_/MRDRNA2_90189_c0_seq1.p1  ORF type:complete len:471 (+),score=83.51 gnl/MRDRNA2_/MRDRNA2_90189_c0_seq1:79-1491(+)